MQQYQLPQSVAYRSNGKLRPHRASLVHAFDRSRFVLTASTDHWDRLRPDLRPIEDLPTEGLHIGDR